MFGNVMLYTGCRIEAKSPELKLFVKLCGEGLQRIAGTGVEECSTADST